MRRLVGVLLACVVALSGCGDDPAPRGDDRGEQSHDQSFAELLPTVRINTDEMSARQVFAHADVAVHGRVVSVEEGREFRIDGQAAGAIGHLVVAIAPDEVLKDDLGVAGEVVHVELDRDHRYDVEQYRAALPTGTEVALLATAVWPAEAEVVLPDGVQWSEESLLSPVPDGLWLDEAGAFGPVQRDTGAPGWWHGHDSWASLRAALTA